MHDASAAFLLATQQNAYWHLDQILVAAIALAEPNLASFEFRLAFNQFQCHEFAESLPREILCISAHAAAFCFAMYQIVSVYFGRIRAFTLTDAFWVLRLSRFLVERQDCQFTKLLTYGIG
jgi:hypothetical protein